MSRGSGGLIGAPADALAVAPVADATAGLHCSFSVQCSRAAAACYPFPWASQSPKAQRLTDSQALKQAGRQAGYLWTPMVDASAVTATTQEY